MNWVFCDPLKSTDEGNGIFYITNRFIALKERISEVKGNCGNIELEPTQIDFCQLQTTFFFLFVGGHTSGIQT